VCEEGLPGWRLGNPDTEVDDTKFAGPITAVQVCTKKLNSRVKSIRVRIPDISDPLDSTYAGSYRTPVLLDRTHCLGWGDWVACPANMRSARNCIFAMAH